MLLESVVNPKRWWIGRIPDGNCRIPVVYRTKVGVAMLADCFSSAMSPLSLSGGSSPALAISSFAKENLGNVADLTVEDSCAPFSNSLHGSEKKRSTPISNSVTEPL